METRSFQRAAEPALAPHLSHDCVDLLKRMLDKAPEKRIGSDEALGKSGLQQAPETGNRSESWIESDGEV